MSSQELTIKTEDNKQVIDITNDVQEQINNGASACLVFVAHTTCAITTSDLDPGMEANLTDAAWEMIPKLSYKQHHSMEHLPSHLAHSIIGPSVMVPVKNGKLVLGTWQRIVLIELDGPRERKVVVSSL